MMDFNELFQDGTTVPPGPGAVDVTGGQTPQPGQNFASMMQGPMEFEAAHVPATTPAEVDGRRQGWMKVWEKFQTNPNLQRALMMVGASMTQPIQPGQTTGGAAANSMVVGMNAYQQGQQQEMAQAKSVRGEARDDARLGLEGRRLAESEKTGAVNRAGTEAGTKRTLLDIETSEKTQADTVKRGHALAEKAVLELENYSDEAGLRKAERALKEQEIRIKSSIPDSVKQQAELDRINELREKYLLAKAQATKMSAEAKIAGQDADLSPEQRARNKQSTTITAEGEKWARLEKAYDNSPTLKQRFPDKQAWLANITTEAKRNPAAMLKPVREVLDSIPATVKKDGKSVPNPDRAELEKVYKDLVSELGGGSGTSQSGAPATSATVAADGKPGSSEKTPMPWPGQAAASKLPSGTYITGPDGQLLRKK